jgi:hypothetical protein
MLRIEGGNLMRYWKFSSMLLAFAMVLVAADPYAGTWKLDPAKSKYKSGAPPKEQIVTISESGGDLDIVVKGVASDGRPLSGHYTIPASGGTGKMIESSAYDGVSGKRISPTERETSFSKNGKVVYTVHSKISSDVKTLTTRVKGTNAAGQMVEGTNVQVKE